MFSALSISFPGSITFLLLVNAELTVQWAYCITDSLHNWIYTIKTKLQRRKFNEHNSIRNSIALQLHIFVFAVSLVNTSFLQNKSTASWELLNIVFLCRSELHKLLRFICISRTSDIPQCVPTNLRRVNTTGNANGDNPAKGTSIQMHEMCNGQIYIFTWA